MSVFAFDDEGDPLEQCDDCGVLIPLNWDKCNACIQKEEYRMRSEALEDPNAGCWSQSW